MQFNRKLFALLLLILPSVAWAADEALVDSLYAKSGMEYQTAQIPASILASMEAERENLNDEQFTSLVSAAAEAFKPEIIGGIIKQQVSSDMSDKEINGVIAWLDSPLGKRITGLEKDVSTPEGYKQMEAFQAGLRDNPPSQARLALVQQFDEAAGLSEFAAEVMINVQLAVISGMMSFMPADRQQPLAALKTQLYASKEQIMASARQMSLISNLYTYQDLTDAEFEKYIAFANTPEGKKYHAVTIQAYATAFELCSRKMGALLGMKIKKGTMDA